jgi:hypothetical protein
MEIRKDNVYDLLDEIYALAHILRLLFEVMENIDIHVNPHAVARFGRMIAGNALRINEICEELPQGGKDKDAACQSERPPPS